MTSELARFRAAIARRLGLAFDDGKLPFLAEVLQRRLDAQRTTAGAYLAGFDSETAPQEELRQLGSELTVGETYFFRNHQQFSAFAELVLPERVAVRASARRLRLLSAGSASGEEAYSLAIVVRDRVDPAWDVAIRAVDINPIVIEKAKRGRYSTWSLRETPPDVQRRWFQPQGRDLQLDETICKAVKFDERNLADEDPELWPPDTYDVVFCRNTLMYFTPEQQQRVIARITRSLVPDGYLFLGHAETLRGLSQDFHLCHTHETFYYQRKHDAASPARPVPLASPAPVLDVSWAASWVDTVQRTSERIRSLSEQPAAPAQTPPSATAAPASQVGRALELLAHERFAEALEQLPEAARDPEALLLRAVLLAHGGKLEAADAACEELLALDELNAGAHYVLALCREGAGDRQGAIDHDHVAAYLDPAFAMPRVHLGLMARRAGDSEAARRELGQAMLLLQREDASRMLLFGGGFSRDALVALCRAGLIGAGGTP